MEYREGCFKFEKVKATYSGCLNIQEVCASLPSLFHLEVLLMAFHSSNPFEKIMGIVYSH